PASEGAGRPPGGGGCLRQDGPAGEPPQPVGRVPGGQAWGAAALPGGILRSLLRHLGPPTRASVPALSAGPRGEAPPPAPGGLAICEHNPFNALTRRAVAGCEFDRDAELLRSHEARRLLREAGLSDPGRRYILFFTRTTGLLRGIERRLGWLPLGAQYAA